MTAGTTVFAMVSVSNADPLDLVTREDLTVDLTSGDDPALDLRLEGNADDEIDTPVVLDVFAGVRLADACQFTASDGFPTGDETRIVSFALREPDECDLASVPTDEIVLRSIQIGGSEFTAALKRDPTFPINQFAPGIVAAAVCATVIVMVASLFAWAKWSLGREPGDRGFWLRRLDSAKLAWTFNDSWLSNLTALGALLATVLAATDVLDVIGPGKPERAVFFFVNLGGLALTALAPLAFQALRGQKVESTIARTVAVRITVRAEKGGSRTLTAELPKIKYRRDNDRLTNPEVGSSSLTTSNPWPRADQHVAVVEIPTHVQGDAGDVDASLRCVALEIPAAGHHDDRALFLYDATVPELQLHSNDGEKVIVAETDTVVRHEAHGRMIGFIVAGLFASVGVAAQLAATYSLISSGDLGDGPRGVAAGVIALIALCAAIYVVRTIMNRLPEVEDADAEDEPVVANPLPVHPVSDHCAALEGTPVAPRLIVNLAPVPTGSDPSALDTVAAALHNLPTYPSVSSAGVRRTSPGDEPLRKRSSPGAETMF